MRYTDILFDNPVFVRELRRRMRGKALIFIIMTYIAAMCAIGYMIVLFQSAVRGNYVHALASIGQSLYATVIAIQAFLVLIVAPGITAAMVRTEREKETFDFLRVTTITPATYLFGALLSTVMFVALALFCALPVRMIAYLYGGVSNIVTAVVLLLLASLALSSGGLVVSCVSDPKVTRKGSLLGVVGLIVFFVQAMTFFVSIITRGGMHAVTVFGVGMPVWVAVALAVFAVSAVMMLVASRKLFDPGERALNYKQFAVVYAAVVGPLVWQMPAVFGIGWGQLALVILVFLVMSLLLQNTFVLSRVENGNERWRIKKRAPWLRNRDDAMIFVTAMTALGLASVGFVAVTVEPRWPELLLPNLLPGLFYLVAHYAVCRLVLGRVENLMKAVRAIVLVDVIAIVIGVTLVQIDLEFLSPVPFLTDKPSGSFVPAIFHGALALGMLLIAARVRPRIEPEPLNYDLEI